MLEYDVLILGGGTAGISVAARCKNTHKFDKIAIIEPSQDHYYQPLWTLVGGGLTDKERTKRPMSSVIPKGVDWIGEPGIEINPEENTVRTTHQTIRFKYLIICTGIYPDWSSIEGLDHHLGTQGIGSVYDYNTVDHIFKMYSQIKEGNLLFTMPKGLLKCGGAPQKIMWILESIASQNQEKRKHLEFHFLKEGQGIFGVEKYKQTLDRLVQQRNIHTHYDRELIRVEVDRKIAVFKDLKTSETSEMPYELLHIVPHFKTLDFLHASGLCNDAGEVAVDAKTLQHVKYPYIWSLGDCSSLPTGKTGAGIRKQAPILVQNLLDFQDGKPLSRAYNGYTACPILTRSNRVVLAEFDYDGNPVESFPFDQSKERYSMFIFKKHLLPFFYWNLMLKGLM